MGVSSARRWDKPWPDGRITHYWTEVEFLKLPTGSSLRAHPGSSVGCVVGKVAVTAASERLAALLGTLASAGSFSARRTAPAGDLSIEVRGIGPLGLPVPDAQARQLCQIGRPARYGQSERTLLDPRVRDTWEIPLSRVRIDKRRWAQTIHPVLERLRRDLGLPDGCELAAELHSMLVYAPGQFFVPHQDSEKDGPMVGSLVVTLPSSFTGGALVVEHGGQRVTYRGSKTSLSFVAFFADLPPPGAADPQWPPRGAHLQPAPAGRHSGGPGRAGGSRCRRPTSRRPGPRRRRRRIQGDGRHPGPVLGRHRPPRPVPGPARQGAAGCPCPGRARHRRQADHFGSKTGRPADRLRIRTPQPSTVHAASRWSGSSAARMASGGRTR